jgi:predicted amidophosphoribosyltransferase
MKKFTVEANKYLKESVQAFYHTDYIGYYSQGNPSYLNDLKNTYDNYSDAKLERAATKLETVLEENFPELIEFIDTVNTVICVMPRAKAKEKYSDDQLRFSSIVSDIADTFNGVENGCEYIIRHTDTRTTHLSHHDTNGSLPYVGITRKTCHIDSAVIGKDILLVDDVYTKTVNVNEDVIQALLDAGAHSVTLFVVAKTKKKY